MLHLVHTIRDTTSSFHLPASGVRWLLVAATLVAVAAVILRVAVILHNKRIVRDPEVPGIVVPSLFYAGCVALVALVVDLAVVYSLAASVSGNWRINLLFLAFVLRLPVHAGLLSCMLSLSYREAMIVQVLEIAIAMVAAPLVTALFGIMLIDAV